MQFSFFFFLHVYWVTEFLSANECTFLFVLYMRRMSNTLVSCWNFVSLDLRFSFRKIVVFMVRGIQCKSLVSSQ